MNNREAMEHMEQVWNKRYDHGHMNEALTYLCGYVTGYAKVFKLSPPAFHLSWKKEKGFVEGETDGIGDALLQDL